MVRPIKIEENQGPLSCTQYDNNIDALLDRSNHTNQITDCEAAINQDSLNQCVSNLSVINNLDLSLSALRTEYQVLSQSITPNGEIDASIQSLANTLNQSLIPIDSALLSIATDLELINPVTSKPYTLNELNAAKNSSSNPRLLTRKRLDGLFNDFNTFKQATEPVILDTKTKLEAFTNNMGPFNTLKTLVEGSITTEVNRVGPIDLRLQVAESDITDLETTLGNPSLLGSKSAYQFIVDNNQDVENNTLKLQTVETDITSVKDEVNDLQLEVTTLDKFFKVTKQGASTSLQIKVDQGVYVRKNGTRGFMPERLLSLGPNTTWSIYIVEDGNTAEPKAFETPNTNGFLIANVITNANDVTNIFDARNAPKVGRSIPYLHRTIGGSGENTSYEASGASGRLIGVHYYENFVVPLGTTLTIDSYAKIHVRNKVDIQGTINVEYATDGGLGLTYKLNGNAFFGLNTGRGLTDFNNYHWDLLAAGSAGSSGIIGGDDGFLATAASGGKGSGGLIIIAGNDIVVNGKITSDGETPSLPILYSTGEGRASGGGGGAGGCIVLQSATSININSNANLSCKGGDGGNALRSAIIYEALGGGGGGGGWISFTAPTIVLNPAADLLVDGGLPGISTIGFRSRPNPAQGGGVGGGFGGRGGNGSSFDYLEAEGEDGRIELNYSRPNA